MAQWSQAPELREGHTLGHNARSSRRLWRVLCFPDAHCGSHMWIRKPRPAALGEEHPAWSTGKATCCMLPQIVIYAVHCTTPEGAVT
jgi:hypothetical protein